MGAEIKVPSVESPELPKVLPLKKPGVGLPPKNNNNNNTTNKQTNMYGFFFNDHPDITALVDWALNTNLLTNSFNAGPR